MNSLPAWFTDALSEVGMSAEGWVAKADCLVSMTIEFSYHHRIVFDVADHGSLLITVTKGGEWDAVNLPLITSPAAALRVVKAIQEGLPNNNGNTNE